MFLRRILKTHRIAESGPPDEMAIYCYHLECEHTVMLSTQAVIPAPYHPLMESSRSLVCLECLQEADRVGRRRQSALRDDSPDNQPSAVPHRNDGLLKDFRRLHSEGHGGANDQATGGGGGEDGGQKQGIPPPPAQIDDDAPFPDPRMEAAFKASVHAAHLVLEKVIPIIEEQEPATIVMVIASIFAQLLLNAEGKTSEMERLEGRLISTEERIAEFRARVLHDMEAIRNTRDEMLGKEAANRTTMGGGSIN